MQQQTKKQSVLSGALMLTIALVIVKVIGVLFKMPLNNMIGPIGRGYFDAAYSIYTPIYAISMAGLPVAVSRMVSENMALGRFRDARLVRRVALRIFLLVGSVATMLLLLIAYPYSKFVTAAGTVTLPAILTIAPSILFCCLMSAYRGYYEGTRNMVPTAYSQLVEAVGKLVTGLVFAKIVLAYGESRWAAAVAAGESSVTIFGTLVTTETQAYNNAIYPWAAAGAVLGVTLGALFGMLFLMVYHKIKGDGLSRAQLVNAPRPEESAFVAKRMIAIAVPILASTLILNLTSLIDTVTIQKRIVHALETNFDTIYNMFQNSLSADAAVGRVNLSSISQVATYLLGASGTASDFRTLIPTITTSVGTSAIPALAAAWAAKDKENIHSTVNTAFRYCTLIALPAGIGMAMLAQPILVFIYGRGNSANMLEIVTPILQAYGLIAVIMAISTPLTNMLQAIGRTDIPVKTMILAASVKVTLNYILVGNPSINIYGAVIGTIVFYLLVVGINMTSLLRVSKVKVQLSTVLFKPLTGALLCGGTAWVTYQLLLCVLQRIMGTNATDTLLCPSNIALGFALVLAVLVYAISLFLLRAITKEDILSISKGEKIAKTLEKLGLLR